MNGHAPTMQTPTKGMGDLSVGPSHDHYDDADSPSKRPRRASAQKNTLYESDGEAGADSDVSEFAGGRYDGMDEEEEVAV